MNKFSKVLMLGLLSLMSVGCKVVTIDGKPIVIDVDPDPIDKYEGNTYKMEYFHGGWFSPYPNFRANLKMEVNVEGKIDALLELKKENQIIPVSAAGSVQTATSLPLGYENVCHIKGQVDAKDFKALDKLTQEAEKKVYDPCTVVNNQVTCTHIADAGYELFTSYSSSTTGKFAPLKAYLSKIGDGMQKGDLVFVNPEPIRKQVDLIIAKLKANSNCVDKPAQSNIKTVKYLLDTGFDRVFQRPLDGSLPAPVRRVEWTLTVSDNAMIVSGTDSTKEFVVNGGSRITRRNFSNYVIEESRREALKQLSVGQRGNVCLIADLFEEEATLGYSDGSLKTGGFGCNDGSYIIDPQGLINYINQKLGLNNGGVVVN